MTTPELHFTAEQEPRVENYRPLSGLAVTALVLGLLSPTALAGPYLLVVPLAGALVSVAALLRIRASEGDYSGSSLAVLGLILSLFFGSWAATQTLGRRWMVSREARQFCDSWLALVEEGKILEAYEWTRPPEDRLAAHFSLEAFYEPNSESRRAMENFFTAFPFPIDEPGVTLRSYRYRGNHTLTTLETGEDTVTHRYEITYEKDGQSENVEALLVAQRIPPYASTSAANSNLVQWQLRSVRPAETPKSF